MAVATVEELEAQIAAAKAAAAPPTAAAGPKPAAPAAAAPKPAAPAATLATPAAAPAKLTTLHSWNSMVGGWSDVVLQPGSYQISGGTVQEADISGNLSGKPATGPFTVTTAAQYRVVLARGVTKIEQVG